MTNKNSTESTGGQLETPMDTQKSRCKLDWLKPNSKSFDTIKTLVTSRRTRIMRKINRRGRR